MHRRFASRTSFFVAVLVLSVAALLAACAASRPVAQVAKAELAIDHAQRNHAPQYALTELQSAQTKLTLAREAMAYGENDQARRLAEQALAEAQLAEAKADSRIAQEQVIEQVDELREEAARLGGTTTTRTTVIRREPKVVVVP
jgi:hypothetical protein